MGKERHADEGFRFEERNRICQSAMRTKKKMHFLRKQFCHTCVQYIRKIFIASVFQQAKAKQYLHFAHIFSVFSSLFLLGSGGAFGSHGLHTQAQAHTGIQQKTLVSTSASHRLRQLQTCGEKRGGRNFQVHDITQNPCSLGSKKPGAAAAAAAYAQGLLSFPPPILLPTFFSAPCVCTRVHVRQNLKRMDVLDNKFRFNINFAGK